MNGHQEVKDKLLALGMMTEAAAMDYLYDGRSGHKQMRLQKQAVRVEIPSAGETERAFSVLYFRTDVEEVKERIVNAPAAEPIPEPQPTELRLSQSQIDRIADAVLSRLGGK